MKKASQVREALMLARQETVDALKALACDSVAPSADLKNLSERLQQIDVALTESDAQVRRIALIASALALAVVVSVLAIVPVRTTEIDGVVLASAVELHYAGVDTLTEIPVSGPLTVTGAGSIRSGGLPRGFQNSDIDRIDVDAPAIVVQRMAIATNSALRVDIAPESIVFSTLMPARDINLQVRTDGESIVTSGSNDPVGIRRSRLSDSELFTVSAPTATASAVHRLEVSAASVRDDYEWSPRAVDGLRFTSPTPPQDTLSMSESSMLQGKLRIGQASRPVDLDAGDQLVLTDFRPTRLHVTLCPSTPASAARKKCDRIQVRLAGTVRDVGTAGSGSLRSLKQSWLEYLKDSSLLGLLWTSGLFMWGTGWSVWKAFRR